MVGSQMNKDAVEDHVLHYCCGNCNMMLFSQRSVIEGMEWDLTEDNQNSTQEIVEQCTTLIVEPLHWMHILPDSIDGYEINCFNCHFSIGVFDPCGFPCHHVSTIQATTACHRFAKLMYLKHSLPFSIQHLVTVQTIHSHRLVSSLSIPSVSLVHDILTDNST